MRILPLPLEPAVQPTHGRVKFPRLTDTRPKPMVKRPMTGRPTRGTTQGGQPSDVPGGHPARLIITEKAETRTLPTPPEVMVEAVDFSQKCETVLADSELESDGTERTLCLHNDMP